MNTATTSHEAFNQGRAIGQKHELLRAAVLAKLAFWEATKHLENAMTDGKGFSDRANDEVLECINDLAAGAPLDDVYSAITEDELGLIIEIVKQHPLEG